MTAQREWFEKDYYKVLGVSESATAKEITKAYRKLARQYHPDANPGDASAEERFKEVSAAYDVVGDEAKRKEYDQVRKMGPLGGFGFTGGAGGPGQGGFSFSSEDLGGLGDLLGGLFGRANQRRGGPGGPGFSRGVGPQRGPDLEAELHLPFLEAVQGITTTVHLSSEATCSGCGGSGSAPGSTPEPCPTCKGRGVVDENQGLFSFSSPCATCRGQGVRITDPCKVCGGSGSELRPREVKVRIPAGVADGKRIRLKGRGGPGRYGGPPGDLYILVHVAPDSVFGRSGEHLTLTVPVTFPEAALGTNLRVPTLGGSTVTLKIPPGTPSGKVFRVRGKGVDTGKRQGDLLVTVEVAVPTTLTPAQKEAVEQLAAVLPDSPRSHLDG